MNSTLVLALLGVYAIVVFWLSRSEGSHSSVEYLLAGRQLSLPAFVATLVTTWYGGILGVGEYGWRYGLSTWLVFGVPYYVAALVFAFALAPRLRATSAMTIPDLLRTAYGDWAARTGAVAVFTLAVPVAYLLMLATLLRAVTGWPTPICLTAGAAFSALYVGISGFRAVIRTDALQLILMFGAFVALVPFAINAAGGLTALWQALPADHRSWDGGLGWQRVAVWYFIALQTIVEPSFYQRVFAARSPSTARRGVVVSVALWFAFDVMTTVTALASRVLLPDLENPVDAFPALAELVLPSALGALFMVGLFATVMSTLDSYLFIAASTIGHDFGPSESQRRRTRIGIAVTAVIAVVASLLIKSPITVWYGVGSVVTSALLLPVIAVHLPARHRFSQLGAIIAMLASAAISTSWLAAAPDEGPYLGVEPMFPALGLSLLCWILDLAYRRLTRQTTRSEH